VGPTFKTEKKKMMKVDCQWLSANIENYFCERLSSEELRLTAEHLETCAACHQETQSLKDVDGLIKQLFDHRLVRARSHRLIRRGLALPLTFAGAGVTLAAVLAFALWTPQDTAPPRVAPLSPPPIAQNSNSTHPPGVKEPSTAPVTRLKPDEPQRSVSTPPTTPDVPVPRGAPAFVVIDPAGYSTTLESYRGSVLLFGVWSADRPEAAHNIDRMYQTFGANPKVRVMGVSNRRQERLAGTSFPVVFNNGSRLLGAGDAQFVLVDPAGNVRLRGSLVGNGDAILTKVKGQLDQLGIR